MSSLSSVGTAYTHARSYEGLSEKGDFRRRGTPVCLCFHEVHAASDVLPGGVGAIPIDVDVCPCGDLYVEELPDESPAKIEQAHGDMPGDAP